MQLQQDRHQGLIALAQQGLIPGKKEVFYQLLCQGAAALNNLPGSHVGQHCAADGGRGNTEVIVEFSVFYRHKRSGQQCWHILKLHQNPVFFVGRIDATNASRLQPHNRRVVTGGDGKVLNTVSVYVQREFSSGFIAVRKAEAPGADYKVSAVTTIAAGFHAVAFAVA